MTGDRKAEEDLLRTALAAARDTRLLELDCGACRRAGAVFESLYGAAPAVVIADDNTFEIAARQVADALHDVGQRCAEPIVLRADGLYAEYAFVEQLRELIKRSDAVPIAVGAGTINDLVKLAAHQCGRPYMAVATAASMDGYTAYGASITFKGSKQTFDCPAPAGVIADLEVIAGAPSTMNAAGYADLAAKCPAGADWILADFLGEEAINPQAWQMVQSRLRSWMEEAEGVNQGRIESLRRVTSGLMMTGFAMQAARSSRPASGAEHQFSHLWDMQHHTHQGQTPSHGFKVGIGSLASLGLYEHLLRQDLTRLDVEGAVQAWPDAAAHAAEISSLFPEKELATKASEESGAKHVGRDALRAQLKNLSEGWPELRRRLSTQLISTGEMRDMLRRAGAAYEPKQIGISGERLRLSYRQAYHIRRRFTVLDAARRSALLEPALDSIFSSGAPAAAPTVEGTR